MRLVVVGTSHSLAPVELRERLAVPQSEAPEVLRAVAGGVGEAVVIATCNRVCLYVADADADAARRRATGELARRAGRTAAELEPWLFTKTDSEATHHLFRVAAGLDSLVPGEGQILGQVREAYELADRAGTVGRVLHRVFRQALHVGKRVRTETSIAESPASVSAAAAELAARVFDDLASRSVLLVGAGAMAELAAMNLVSRGVRRIVVANRSLERAYLLAARVGGRAVSLHAVPEELAEADVVISSTGADGFVLSADVVAPVLRRRRGRPMFFIDIAVPRDVDPAVNRLPGAYLYDVDDLERVVAESLAGRRGEAQRAERIVRDELEGFSAWRVAQEVVPAIVALRRRAEEIRLAELGRLERRLGELGPSERRAVDALTSQIVNKLLHLPTVRLKEAAATPDGALYAETVRDLFDLRDGEA